MAARDLTRRSRRQLGWLLGGFVLCQALLAVAVESWLPRVRDPEHSARLECLRALRAAAPDRPLILALGSSRVAFGLDARRLSVPAAGKHPLVFNFALMGSGPLLELVMLRRLLDDGHRPEQLYVEVMPAMFLARGERRLEERMLDGARLRAGEVALLRPHYREAHRLLSSWGLGRLLPCYRHQAELRACLRLDGPPALPPGTWTFDAHGWCCRDDFPNAEERHKATHLAHSQYGEFCAADTLAAEPVATLRALVELCRQERISVSLVLMPEGETFRSLYRASARAALEGLVRRARGEWGVAVLDARTWVEEADFWDGHHLLASGARRFSERFAREVLHPALATPPAAARAQRP
jgi:hypothetical protein